MLTNVWDILKTVYYKQHNYPVLVPCVKHK